MIQFSLVTLHVHDMEKSLHFYNILLQIPILRKQAIGPQKELIFMGVEGQPNLELIPSDDMVSYSGFSIGFEVQDLAAVKNRLSSNGYAIKQEFSPSPSTTLCFLDGPNGEQVELIAYA